MSVKEIYLSVTDRVAFEAGRRSKLARAAALAGVAKEKQGSADKRYLFFFQEGRRSAALAGGAAASAAVFSDARRSWNVNSNAISEDGTLDPDLRAVSGLPADDGTEDIVDESALDWRGDAVLEDEADTDEADAEDGEDPDAEDEEAEDADADDAEAEDADAEDFEASDEADRAA